MNRPDGRHFSFLAAEAELGGIARAVYRVLDDHANSRRQSRPAVATIAFLAGFGKTAVRYALRDLEDAGFVERREQEGKPAVYVLCDLSTTPPHTGGANGCTPPPNPTDPTAKPHRPHRLAVPKEMKELERSTRARLARPQAGAAQPPEGAAAPSTDRCPRCANPDYPPGARLMKCPDCGNGWVP